MKKTPPQTLLPGISRPIAEANERIAAAAENDAPVFLTGEVGTEKSFAAKLIHQLSSRNAGPLGRITVSWKLPPDLAQHIEQTRAGTLIISLQKDFPIDMQYTLVEIAGDGSFTDPMSGEAIDSHARILIMTSLDLEALSARTPLLPELRDLLINQHIEIPPLRNRMEDIPALVRYALKRAHDTGRSDAETVDPQVLALFRHCDWPGNAEDLLLVTAQAAISAKGTTITLDDLPETFLSQVDEEKLQAAKAVRTPRPTSRDKTPTRPDIDTVAEDLQPTPPQTPEPTPDQLPIPNQPTTPTPPKDLPQPTPDATAGIQSAKHLLSLARRLSAQSAVLKEQMSGPLETHRDPGAPATQEMERLIQDIPEIEALNALEAELDRSLELIHALRRQMALLNMRQQQSAETIRDLVNRITALSSPTMSPRERDEITQETKELAESLKVVDEIFQRVSNEIPRLEFRLQDDRDTADDLRTDALRGKAP